MPRAEMKGVNKLQLSQETMRRILDEYISYKFGNMKTSEVKQAAEGWFEVTLIEMELPDGQA